MRGAGGGGGLLQSRKDASQNVSKFVSNLRHSVNAKSRMSLPPAQVNLMM